jgi:geranylgeranyl pyrophosphate synthase
MFDLASHMRERRDTLNRELDAALPREDVPPVELHRAMRHGVLSGGKRLRPILCLAAAESVGSPAASAMAPAVAVELLHAYTLIHDDLPCMDDDDLRRGVPTCHKLFGEATALLAGDALQALAFGIAAAAPLPPGAAPGILAVELASAAGSLGVVGGQAEDLALRERAPTAEAVAFVHRHKTADLFRAALRMGAIAGGASPAELAALTDYGVKLGIAFQIADDLLDAASDGGQSGSPYLAVHGLPEARRRARELADGAAAALRPLRPLPARDALSALARLAVERAD